MATIKKPIRIGDDTPLRNFQTGEAVGPDHGGTGIVTSELTGQAGKVLTVNGTGDGYTLAAGGGGNGIYGGSGTVPANTTASVSGQGTKLFFGEGASSYKGITIGNPSHVSKSARIEVIQGTDGPFVGKIDIVTINNIGEEAALVLGGAEVVFNAKYGGFFATDQFEFTVVNSSGVMYFTGPGQKIFRSENSVAAEYESDYSADMATNENKIPSVKYVNTLKQTPVSYTNAAAPNNAIFYSTTDSKLSYKDPGGAVHNLY